MKQLRAIIWMRWRMMAHSLRKGSGVVNLIGQILGGLLWGTIALGAAALVSALIHEALAEARNDYLFYSFTMAFVFATVCGFFLPHMMETSRTSMDVSRLLVFPISGRRLFLISQAANIGAFEHLLYFPSLVGVLVFGVSRCGSGLLSGLGIVVSMWIFVLVWSHTLGLLLQTIMRKRRNREIVAIITVVVLILVIYGPTIFGASQEVESPDKKADFSGLIQWLDGSGRILVPVMAAQGLAALARGESGPVVNALAWIWAWIAGGLVLGNVFFIQFSIGTCGKIPSNPSSRKRTSTTRIQSSSAGRASRFSFLPSVVTGVAIKELRYIVGSLSGRMSLLFSPVFVTMIVVVYARKLSNPVFGIGIDDALLFGIFLFTTQTLSSLRSNSMTWEGSGVCNYFLSPVSLTKVLLGKNLALLAFHCLILVINVIIWSLLRSVPSPSILITGVIFFLGMDLAFLAVGNLLSLTFPSGSDIAARKINTSGVVNLISLGEMIIIGGIHGLFLWAPVWLGYEQWQPVSMLIILVLDGVVYSLLLRPASLMFSHNREKIIGNLKSAID